MYTGDAHADGDMKEADHRRGRGSEQQRGCIARAWGKRLEEVLFYRIAGSRTAGIDL